MDSIDPLSLIPPEWVALAAPWAARAFVALLLTTALVRLLLPVARRVEVWAIASAVTWDDGPARKAVEVLEWMAAASAILAWVPRLTIGRAQPKVGRIDHTELRRELVRGRGDSGGPRARIVRPPAVPRRPIADRVIGCVHCGKPAALVDEPIPEDGLCEWCRDEVTRAEDEGDRMRGPSALGVLLLIVAAAYSAATIGCGPGALGMQARAAQVTAIATGGAGEVIDAARDRALDAVEEAHPIRGPERDAALDAEAERWRPAGQALDAIRSALVTWIAAIEAARVVGEQGMAALWPQVLALGAQVVGLYARIGDLARELGADVPTLDLGGLLGTSTTSTGGAR